MAEIVNKIITTLKRAAGYLRRSGDKQENSLSDQKREINKHAEANGFQIVRFYTDDAISGTSTHNREGFQEMIETAKSRQRDFEYILTWDVKRFSRGDSDEAGYYRYLLRQNGVEVIYISENFKGDDSDDLVLGTKQWLARQESKDKSRDVIRGMLSRIDKGLSTSGHPYGCYRQIEDKNGVVIQVCKRGEKSRANNEDYTRLIPGDKKEIEVIRRIFDCYVNRGMGYRLIARMLNQEGIPSPKNKKWNLCAIEFILSNEIYIGNLVYNKTSKAKFHRIIRTENGFEAQYKGKVAMIKMVRYKDKNQWIRIDGVIKPPIIEKELFYKVQEIRKQRITNKSFSGKATTSNYLWSGVIRCVHCNRSMYGITVKTPYGKNPYYTCPGCQELGVRKKSIVSATQLDALLLGRIKVKFFDSDRLKNVLSIIKDRLSEQSKNRSIAVAEICKSIAEIDKKIDAVLDSLDPRHKDLINQKLDGFSSEKTRLTAKKEELLNAKIDFDVDKVSQEILGCAEDFDRVMLEGTPSERKELLKSYIGKIFIDTDIKQAKVGFYPLPKTPSTEPFFFAIHSGVGLEYANMEGDCIVTTNYDGYAPILE